MFSNWKRMRQRARYGRYLRNESEKLFRAGDLCKTDYDNVVRGTHDPQVMDQMIANSIRGDGLLGEFDWEGLLDWIRENLIPLIEMILPLVLMFLDKPDDTEAKDEAYKVW